MSDQLLSLVDLVTWALILLILARSLYSWIDPTMQSQIGRLLRQLTEPIIAPIRQVVPSAGAIDFSPLIAWIVILLIQRVLHQVLA